MNYLYNTDREKWFEQCASWRASGQLAAQKNFIPREDAWKHLPEELQEMQGLEGEDYAAEFIRGFRSERTAATWLNTHVWLTNGIEENWRFPSTFSLVQGPPMPTATHNQEELERLHMVGVYVSREEWEKWNTERVSRGLPEGKEPTA